MPEKKGIAPGVVEGFYGVFYTHAERTDLIRFLGAHGFGRYVYAPKNDRQHRARWWEAYPSRMMDEFAEAVRVAQDAGVEFCYAISPGGSIEYRSPFDFARLTLKLSAFYAIGVRSFALMLDDNEPGFRHESDGVFYTSLPAAQADLANRLYNWLLKLDPCCTLFLVPSSYSGTEPFAPALVELARLMNPQIGLCYTGPEICSPEITADDAIAFSRATGRKPIIWDNYPVNDLAMHPQLHLGPLTGRDAGLPEMVDGILFNPMAQAEASKIPLLTCAAYCADPVHYEPQPAWNIALREAAGKDYIPALRLLAENCDISCLNRGGEKLDRLARLALDALRLGAGTGHSAVAALEGYLREIDEATYLLKFRMENIPLRNNLLPWIEILEHWMWIARFSLDMVRCVEQGRPCESQLVRVHEYEEAIRTSSKRIAAQELQPLVNFAVQIVLRREKTNESRNRFSIFDRLSARQKQKKTATFTP